MRIGVVKETKPDEYRVALTPAGTHELVHDGHEVVVETGAGEGSSLPDEAYGSAGARIAERDEVWAAAELLLKVKEPVPEERAGLRDQQTLFAYLHLAADGDLTRDLLASGATCIAYETVREPDGTLPLLAPMSEVAGRLATQMAAWALERSHGGRGVLLGGVPGVPPGRVLVVGGGVVGRNAALIASGMRADVWVFDTDVERLRQLETLLGGQAKLLVPSRLVLEDALSEADVVIGAVLVPGARAPKLLTRDMLAAMPPGSVLVDVSIDQGGCFETSRPTTHSDPTFEVDGIIHYCVANMPGAVPLTATFALTNATLPYVRSLAGLGTDEAVRRFPALAHGVNVAGGRITHPAVAEAHRLEHVSLASILETAQRSRPTLEKET